jgi:HSP20 family protein
MLRTNSTQKDNPLMAWQRDMNEWFDKFNRDLELPRLMTGEYSPRVEIREKDRGYIVLAEIPGMAENDVSVTLKDNSLVIEGERKSVLKKEERPHYYTEFNYGRFYRSIPFEFAVNPDKVSASYKNGVLCVELEKLKGLESIKKIPILKS